MLDKLLTLKKIEIFLNFMTEGTLAETAEKTGMSTVSIHRAIHSLEESLKCPLFRHEGRLLVPLPSAMVLEHNAKKLVFSFEEAIRLTREAAGIYSNQIKIGALYSLTLKTVPRLVAGIKLRKSELDIELTLGGNVALFKKLDMLELDTIFVSLSDDFHSDEYTFLRLFSDDMMLAVPANSDISTKKTLSLVDFKDETFISLSDGFATHKDSFKAFELAGITPNIAMKVDDIFSIICMVSGGVGYALLPKRVEAVFDNMIKLIPLKELAGIKQHISLVCLANREREPRILTCIAESRAYVRERTNINKG